MNKKVQGILKENFSLSRLTSWHVGGAAALYFRPSNLEDLQYFLQHAHDQSDITWLGLGSNVLVRDGGIQHTVIHTLNRLQQLEPRKQLVYVQAGVPCAKFAKWCMKHGLSGAEFLAGIPGTMGGALRMNAGAYGGDTWRIVAQAQLLNAQGELTWVKPSELTIGYRLVEGFGEQMFAGALFALTESTTDSITEYTRKMLQTRNAAQPIGSFNCGSVFRNPEGDYAGRLIADCGLKGFAMGDAIVSEKHANFIINQGHATADDIESLIEYVQAEVLSQKGVALFRECHLLGERIQTHQEVA